MLNSSLSSQELQRYARQINLQEIGMLGQEKLKHARVLCVGLGGLGSSLLLYLAGAGVGRLGLVDSDTVELSNLHRQTLYRETQVGFSKAESASAQLLELNSSICVDTYGEKLTEDNAASLVAEYDIVADCSDNFYTNYLLHDVCFLQRKPYVYASVSQFKGYCSLFHLDSKDPCLRCLFPMPDPLLSPTCSETGILGVVPGIVASIQAAEILKWIVGIGQLLTKKVWIADVLNRTFREIELSKSPDCPLCVHKQSQNTLYYPSRTSLDKCLVDFSISMEDMLGLIHLENKQVRLIDVRSTEEHEFYNIGGKCIPLNVLEKHVDMLNPDTLTILYCHSGQRSIEALKLLMACGFTSLRYLRGGISIFRSNMDKHLNDSPTD